MSLEDKLANMSLYDAKKYFRRAQNVMFNYTEMEAKVREATNNEPWGASSTLMEQIAQGTYNIREREEILGMIFRRFTEKTGSEWRQLYKALQLLDYLIRHGSERFIDDTRSSVRLIELLESFHYIDSEGRDQGINVRNRAKQLTDLLKDDSKIRSERKNARETTKKYKGIAGDNAVSTAAAMNYMNTSAGFNRSRGNGISVSADFDHDSDDDLYNNQRTNRKAKEPEQDLFTFGDDDTPNKSSSFASNDNDNDNDDADDDEFADFQSALPVTQVQTPAPIQGSSLLNLTSSTSSNFNNANVTKIIPAIANTTKKADPFSSLFTTAKTENKTVEKKEVIAPEKEDDLFGDMTSAPATASAPAPAPAPATNNTGDLLDLI